jgi:hypothetical protein
MIDRIQDGLACLHCGKDTGAMVPAGRGERGQLFAHPECIAELGPRPVAARAGEHSTFIDSQKRLTNKYT